MFVQQMKFTLEMPFLIAISFILTAAIVFLALGINHIKQQQQKLDQNLPYNQAIVYQANGCAFSTDTTTNEIINLMFVFACFHTGMISTVYFFLHSAPDIKSKRIIRKTSTSSVQGKIQIQLLYHDHDEIQTKMVSI